MEKINFKEEVANFIEAATVKEKIQLLTGAGAWETRGYLSKNIPTVVMTDGPNGVRRLIDDRPGLGKSFPATAFPVAALVASTWNLNLVARMGAAMGLEAREQNVDVLLGPGLNIKRTPLCGRNFEYFSEDPYVSGKIASAMVKGMQNVGVGATIKHYAANSQETERLLSNSIVDERALREIYLKGFEIAVKESAPALVMSSYNLINGVYGSENKYTLNVLRNEWQYNGVIVSDWGGMHDPIPALKAGHDLEMPGNKRLYKIICDAYKEDKISLGTINQSVERLVELALNAGEARKVPREDIDYDRHFDLAREIAADGMVLLENNGTLPLNKAKSVAVIGAFAENPRFQGAGSSKVNPKKLDNLLIALKEAGITYEYAQGYDLLDQDSQRNKAKLIAEAVETAKKHEQVILMVGLPTTYDVEGRDRRDLRMPRAQYALIEKISAINPNVVIVVNSGSAVEMPWVNKVGATLMAYLGGAASGGATTDILFGDVNPSGHLTETIPYFLGDVPSSQYLGKPGYRNIEYRESIYVGYRYYEKANVRVAFPFGHGLSYSSFEIANLALSRVKLTPSNNVFDVSFEITNTSDIKGQEVVQLYIGQDNPISYKPLKELKAFRKVELKAHETKKIKIKLSSQDLEYWNVNAGEFAVENGTYKIYVGVSSADIRATATLKYQDKNQVEPVDFKEVAPIYYNVKPYGKHFSVEKEMFEAVYGGALKTVALDTKRPFTTDDAIIDAKSYWTGRLMIRVVKRVARKLSKSQNTDEETYITGALETPLRSLSGMSGGLLSERQIAGLLDMMNGKVFPALWKLITKEKEEEILF